MSGDIAIKDQKELQMQRGCKNKIENLRVGRKVKRNFLLPVTSSYKTK
jgi:hypothetical protein